MSTVSEGPKTSIAAYAALGAMALQILDTTVTMVAMPYIQKDMQVTQAAVAGLVTAYMVSVAAIMPMSGWLARRLGRRNVLLWTLFGFALSSMWCGMIRDIDLLTFARLVQGAFGAPLMPLAQSIIQDQYPPTQQKEAAAKIGSVLMLAPVIGPTLGGLISQFAHWSWVFYINVPVCLLVAVILYRHVPKDTPAADTRLDIRGFALFSIAMVAAQFALDRTPIEGWSASAPVQIATWTALVGLALYGVHHILWHRETKHPEKGAEASAKPPYFNQELLNDRAYSYGIFFSFITGALLFATISLMPGLMTGYGFSAFAIGLLMAPRGLSSALAMSLAGKRIARFSIDASLIIGLALIIFSLAFALLLGRGADTAALAAMALVQGVGLAFLTVGGGALPYMTIAPRLRPEGAGFNTLARYLGGSIGIAVCQNVLALNGSFDEVSDPKGLLSNSPIPWSYVATFGFLVALCLACMLLVVLLRPGRIAAEAEAARA